MKYFFGTWCQTGAINVQNITLIKPIEYISNLYVPSIDVFIISTLHLIYNSFLDFFFQFSSADAYNIFIDSGSNPDTYLSPDFNQIFNNSSSLYFNGSFDGTSNSTPIFTQSNINDTNNSETYTNIPGEEVTELVIMAVTSIILGLVILITVIGNYFMNFSYSGRMGPVSWIYAFHKIIYRMAWRRLLLSFFFRKILFANRYRILWNVYVPERDFAHDRYQNTWDDSSNVTVFPCKSVMYTFGGLFLPPICRRMHINRNVRV